MSKSKDRYEQQKAARRFFVWEAVVRLPTGFTTREASDALVALDRHIRYGFRSNDELYPHAYRAKRALQEAGLYSGPQGALNYLKELEKQGLLVKRLIHSYTREPLDPDQHGSGTYQWFWVGEEGIPEELAA